MQLFTSNPHTLGCVQNDKYFWIFPHLSLNNLTLGLPKSLRILGFNVPLPLGVLYKEPLGYIEGGEIEEQGNYSPLLPHLSLYFSLHRFVPWSTQCSSQAFLFFVRFLSRDGGLKWWRAQFLQFTEVPTEFVTIVSLIY